MCVDSNKKTLLNVKIFVKTAYVDEMSSEWTVGKSDVLINKKCFNL